MPTLAGIYGGRRKGKAKVEFESVFALREKV
jgi:hypothetical protein